jgi:hypothetical protein
MVIYRAKNAVGKEVAVQFQYGSTNSKTGDGVQVWIMPMSWVERGKEAMSDDEASCMDCVHSKRVNATCYVRKGMSDMGLKSKVSSLNKAYQSGDIVIRDADEIASNEVDKCRGKFVRFGAYGEPVLLGQDNVKAIADVARNYTGYTHQWHVDKYGWASRYFMASVENELLMRKANGRGWRTFRVRGKHDDKFNDEVMCPASKESGRRVTCDKCGLCKGQSIGAKSITIIKH